MKINWESILLDLWESGDTYRNRWATIEIFRKFPEPYRVTDAEGRSRVFRSHKKCVQYLVNLENQQQ